MWIYISLVIIGLVILLTLCVFISIRDSSGNAARDGGYRPLNNNDDGDG